MVARFLIETDLLPMPLWDWSPKAIEAGLTDDRGTGAASRAG